MTEGRAARNVGAAVIALVPVAALVVVALLLRPRLGASMGSHWASGPYPNSFTSTWAAFWTFGAITAALTAAAVIVIAFAAVGSASRVFPAVGVLAAGLTASAWIAPAWATADADSPEHARLGARLLILLFAVVCAGVVYLLLPAVVPAPSPEAVRPSMPLAEDERASWTAATNSALIWVAAGVSAACFVGVTVIAATGQRGFWPVVAVLGIATVLGLGFARMRLTVDGRGIRLASLVLGVTLIRIGLDNIEAVAADVIEPAQWGGWGLRVSGAGLAYVTRRGPGVVITRRSGSAVAITIDQADQAAAVANALIAQRAARSR